MIWWMWWTDVYLTALIAYLFGIYLYYAIKDGLTGEHETWAQYILVLGGVYMVSLFALLRFS